MHYRTAHSFRPADVLAALSRTDDEESRACGGRTAFVAALGTRTAAAFSLQRFRMVLARVVGREATRQLGLSAARPPHAGQMAQTSAREKLRSARIVSHFALVPNTRDDSAVLS